MTLAATLSADAPATHSETVPAVATKTVRRTLSSTITVIVVTTFAATWLFAVIYDNTPAHYDSATNFLRAMNIRQFVRTGDLDSALRWYWYYPNGESWIVNGFFAILGATYRSAVLSNGLWIGVLVRSLVLLGRRMSLKPSGQLVLFAIVLGSPILIGSTHELILDLPMLTLFVCLLVSLRSVPDRAHLSGWIRPATVAGCCLLIKWSVLPWVVSAVVVELIFRRRQHQNLWVDNGERRATPRTWLGFAVVFVACLWWYGGNHQMLLHDIMTKGINAGLAEGDPQGVGLRSLQFYGAAFVTSYAWLPTTIALLCLFVLSRHRSPRTIEPELWSWPTTAALGIGGPNLLFLLWQSNKDARYALPMIVLLGLVIARCVDRLGANMRAAFTAVLSTLALVSIVSINGPWGTTSVSWNSLPVIGAAGYTAPRPIATRNVYDDVVAHVEKRRRQLGCGQTFVVRDEVLGVRINQRTIAARLVERGWAWGDPGQGCVGIVITRPDGTPDAGAAAVGISTATRQPFPTADGTIWVVSPALR